MERSVLSENILDERKENMNQKKVSRSRVDTGTWSGWTYFENTTFFLVAMTHSTDVGFSSWKGAGEDELEGLRIMTPWI